MTIFLLFFANLILLSIKKLTTNWSTK